MKKLLIICTILFLNGLFSFSQTTIPQGISLDSIIIKEIHSPHNLFNFYYYKPVSYNSSSSPILFAIHGLSTSGGLSPINDLINIAERRKALIIAPDFNTSIGFRQQEPLIFATDSFRFCKYYISTSEAFKQLYRHILVRENRVTIPSYMIGFSAGGQFVTRYLIFRQSYPDSIPLRMSVSTNAYYYTFPTDSFNNVQMLYLCGFYPNPAYWNYQPGTCSEAPNFYNIFCNEHVLQYYNENYGVLIGTGDISQLYDLPCGMIQGANRYERAQTFYNFCDSNAQNIGTTLQWRYDSVIGVGHNQNLMYNTKRNATDSSTIAESLLFDTPYHSTSFNAPLARFYANTTVVTLPNATVHFTNTSVNATSYFWDFGDGTTSTAVNPTHTYTNVATYPYRPGGGFSVQLTATNSNGCQNWSIKRYYILVKSPTGFENNIDNNIQFQLIPNPNNGIFIVLYDNKITNNNYELFIYDLLGNIVYKSDIKPNYSIDLSTQPKGIYLYKINFENEYIKSGKLIIQ